jgi:hypothetical protein
MDRNYIPGKGETRFLVEAIPASPKVFEREIEKLCLPIASLEARKVARRLVSAKNGRIAYNLTDHSYYEIIGEVSELPSSESLWEQVPLDIKSGLDQNLEIRAFSGPAPELIGTFENVLVKVPELYDEKAGRGDLHLKNIPARYLVGGGNFISVPEHYARYDYPFEVKGKLKKVASTVRNFYIGPEYLGKEIIAPIQIFRNSDGSLSINIKNVNIKLATEQRPSYRISMREAKNNEIETENVFLIPGSSRCVELIPAKNKKS